VSSLPDRARYPVRIVKNERAGDRHLEVLADNSTDARDVLGGKVGNRSPRDPLKGRRSRA